MMGKFRFDPSTFGGLDALGRIPLSDSFHLREFLYSEIAVHYGLRNVPDDIDRAVWAGSMLCQKLLDPLQDRFGRIHVRSGYRSRAVNKAGVKKHKCAENNDGAHTWDYPSQEFGFGAMACISVPSISRAVLSGAVEASAVAWWIFDHWHEWSVLEFFAPPNGLTFADEVVFNIGWNERPQRAITNWRGGPRALHKQVPDGQMRTSIWSELERACPVRAPASSGAKA